MHKILFSSKLKHSMVELTIFFWKKNSSIWSSYFPNDTKFMWEIASSAFQSNKCAFIIQTAFIETWIFLVASQARNGASQTEMHHFKQFIQSLWILQTGKINEALPFSVGKKSISMLKVNYLNDSFEMSAFFLGFMSICLPYN